MLSGIGLPGYAWRVYRIGTRDPMPRKGAMPAAILNARWVIGSGLLLVTNRAPLAPGGRSIVAAVAGLAGGFAVLPFFGLRQPDRDRQMDYS